MARTAHLHEGTPPPPSPELDAYRRTMRDLMRRAMACGAPSLSRTIALYRAQPDHCRAWSVLSLGCLDLDPVTSQINREATIALSLLPVPHEIPWLLAAERAARRLGLHEPARCARLLSYAGSERERADRRAWLGKEIARVFRRRNSAFSEDTASDDAEALALCVIQRLVDAQA